MIQVATYTVDEVFSAMEVTQGKSVLPDGVVFRRNNARLVLFHTKGVACVRCGVEGNLFVLETQNETIKPHLNLYAVVPGGKRILMTKDHIQPKSKGGANEQVNYDPMCSPCNGKKGNKVPN